jgi:F-type H+-transporting ATPase subunit alpha
LASIAETTDLSDASVEALSSAMDAFKREFTTSSGELLVKDVPVEALAEEDVEHAQITRKARAGA